jgi:hypothetical protein
VSPDKIDYSALTWYPDANKLIRKIYGDNWELFVDLLAATSPRQSIKRNWRQTAAILAAYITRQEKPKQFGRIIENVMYSHLPNVIRALQRRPINGPKVSRFAENLKGNLQVVTIDVWICKAYGIDQKKLTSALYNRLEKKIQADAKRAKTTPAGLQAVIWYAIRRNAGLKVKSFVSVFSAIARETPLFPSMIENE